MAKNRFSKAWLDQHRNDPYVKQAQARGYRSRAAFKLLEIDQQDKLIQPGHIVVDLGCTPGAWSQVLRERLATGTGGINGQIIALDLLPMEPIANVQFIQGDFREDDAIDALAKALGGRRADLIVSDMAHNLSGVGLADAARMADLIDLAADFALEHLKPEGALLVKCFHGSGYSQIVERFKRTFARVAPRKPKSSRDQSAETYLLGRGLKR